MNINKLMCIIIFIFIFISCVSGQYNYMYNKNNNSLIPEIEIYEDDYNNSKSKTEYYNINDKETARNVLIELQNRLKSEARNKIYKSVNMEIRATIDLGPDNDLDNNSIWIANYEHYNEYSNYKSIYVGIRWNLITILVVISTNEPVLAENQSNYDNMDFLHDNWKFVLSESNLNNLLILQSKILE